MKVVVLLAIALPVLLDLLVDRINLRHSERAPQPEDFPLPEQERRKSLEYLASNTNFGDFQAVFMLAVQLVFFLSGGYGLIDRWSRDWGLSIIPTGVLFLGTLGFLSQLISLPFAYYHQFVIEERFGFNRSTLRTFVLDIVKGAVLGILVGAPVLAAVLWFFETTGDKAWLYAWGFLVVVQLVLIFLAPLVIMPLFNKFTPLPDGELKKEIEDYANSQRFVLSGIFTMDGSKRSSKANAFFTGFGRSRRIVLFDTLVEKHSVQELVAVLAHEVGHYRLRHIPKRFALSLLSSAVLLYVLSRLMAMDPLYAAFGISVPSKAAGLLMAALLYGPVSLVLGVFSSYLSRKHEFEADAFAARTAPKGGELITALKKMSVDNKANLTPHPLKVWLEYSHPPVTERIKALRACLGRTAEAGSR